MVKSTTRALSEVLDQLEHTLEGENASIEALVNGLGSHAFAPLMLVFALISTSPASSMPGVTSVVAITEFIIVVQMLAGRSTLWLPAFISHRSLAKNKLCKGIAWLRKPVHFVERFLKPRLTMFIKPPWIYLPLVLILIVTPCMLFMEFIPMSGSIASAAIALFAAGLLTRDGLLVVVSIAALATLPLLIWYLGFA